MIYYNASLNGFFNDSIHRVIPDGSIEITEELYLSLFTNNSYGIKPDESGNPVLIEYIQSDVEKIANISDSVQSHLNKSAKDLGYDSIASAVSYADEPSVPKFQQEGQALRAWRSLVWEKCYQILAEFETGNIEAPTPEEVITQLPELVV